MKEEASGVGQGIKQSVVRFMSWSLRYNHSIIRAHPCHSIIQSLIGIIEYTLVWNCCQCKNNLMGWFFAFGKYT